MAIHDTNCLKNTELIKNGIYSIDNKTAQHFDAIAECKSFFENYEKNIRLDLTKKYDLV